MKTGVDLYYCDNCGISCPSITHFNRHKKTNKHKKNEKLDRPITCKHCNETFTIEGYERHKKRNKLFWEHKKIDKWNFITDECTCNNFLFFDRRYARYGEIITEANDYILKYRYKCETYSDYTSCSSHSNTSESESDNDSDNSTKIKEI